jgi:predicted ATP-binding protein involved in virulence
MHLYIFAKNNDIKISLSLNCLLMESEKIVSIYAAILSIEMAAPFKNPPNVNFFSNDPENVYPAQWTIIVGNNNTGKTRLLKLIGKTLSPDNKKESKIRDVYEEWIHEQTLIGLNELDINTKEIDEKSFDIIVDSTRKKVLDHLNEIPDVVITTMFRREVLDSLGIGNYFPSKLGDNNKLYDNTLITIDEGKFLCTIPEGNYPFVIGYGVNRRSGESNLSVFQEKDSLANLLEDKADLINIEDWLIQTDYAIKNKIEEAEFVMNKIKTIINSGILPDVSDFRFTSEKTKLGIKSFVEFKTSYGWTTLNNLGYGYQGSINWLLDLTKRMIGRYGQSDDPLSMPAIVLIDEIDLHLHPAWQRKILKHLSEIFVNIQFIVTTHSPLVIQSAENVNLILLQKDEDHVNITQPDIYNYRGWSVEEIMSELMGLQDHTFSDTYLKLMSDFDQALDDENYQNALSTYKKLDEILPPESAQRKILRIQMSSIPISN